MKKCFKDSSSVYKHKVHNLEEVFKDWSSLFGDEMQSLHEVEVGIAGVRGSLVVTFTAIVLQGPRFKSRSRQTFETRFLIRAHPYYMYATGTTTAGT